MSQTTEKTNESAPSQKSNKLATYQGGCHCGEVRFEADLDLSGTVGRCNCTLCVKRSAAGVIIRPEAFRLIAGADSLGDYAWGARNGHFRFCKRCGIHVFGHGHLDVLGGDFVSVNVLCIDELDPATLRFHYWDGRHDNWQAGPRATPWPVAAWPRETRISQPTVA